MVRCGFTLAKSFIHNNFISVRITDRLISFTESESSGHSLPGKRLWNRAKQVASLFDNPTAKRHVETHWMTTMVDGGEKTEVSTMTMWQQLCTLVLAWIRLLKARISGCGLQEAVSRCQPEAVRSIPERALVRIPSVIHAFPTQAATDQAASAFGGWRQIRIVRPQPDSVPARVGSLHSRAEHSRSYTSYSSPGPFGG